MACPPNKIELVFGIAIAPSISLLACSDHHEWKRIRNDMHDSMSSIPEKFVCGAVFVSAVIGHSKIICSNQFSSVSHRNQSTRINVDKRSNFIQSAENHTRCWHKAPCIQLRAATNAQAHGYVWAVCVSIPEHEFDPPEKCLRRNRGLPNGKNVIRQKLWPHPKIVIPFISISFDQEKSSIRRNNEAVSHRGI